MQEDINYEWAHGNEEECDECQFYIMVDSGYGYCRRYPPKTEKVGWWWNRTYDITYQIVEWCRRACGEYKLRESKNVRTI